MKGERLTDAEQGAILYNDLVSFVGLITVYRKASVERFIELAERERITSDDDERAVIDAALTLARKALEESE